MSTGTDLAHFDDLALERFDSLIENALSGIGDPEYDRTVHNQVGFVRRLPQRDLETLYQHSWICQNCIDLYPDEATREWLDVRMGGKKSDRRTIDKFNQYQKRLGVPKAFETASQWARLYGGAVIIPVVLDGQPMDKPIKPESIKSIRKLLVLDRHDIRPVMQWSDPANPEFYEFIMAPVVARRLQDAIGKTQLPSLLKIHHSRVFRFDGREMPPKILEKNEGWGISILDAMYTTFSQFETTSASIANLVDESSLFIYAMKGLANLLSANDEKSLSILMNRLRAIRRAKSSHKMLLLDAELETATVVQRPLTGLPEILDRSISCVVGASRIPTTILLGRGPMGLAAQGTGDTEQQSWSKLVAQFQNNTYSPLLRSYNDEDLKLFDLIWWAQDGPTKGKPPDDWGFEFKSLQPMTDKEKADLRSSQSNTDRTYVDMGVLLKEEVRASRFDGEEYSIETQLDEQLWNEKQQEEDDAFDEFDDFGGEFGASGADSNGAAPPGQAPPGQENQAMAGASPGAKNPARSDSLLSATSERTKFILNWNGLRIGITHQPGDLRHGKPMAAHYGRIFGSYGDAEDGMAIDCYLGPNPDSKNAFRVRQNRPDGTFDETKWVFGCHSLKEARDLFLRHMPQTFFGGIDPAPLDELKKYRHDCSADCSCNGGAIAPGSPPPERKKSVKKNSQQQHRKSRWWDHLETEIDREDSDRFDKACGKSFIPDDHTCHSGKSGDKPTQPYMVWVENRRTPIVVDANSEDHAREVVKLKRSVGSGNTVLGAKPAEDKDLDEILKGKWVRTRLNPDGTLKRVTGKAPEDTPPPYRPGLYSRRQREDAQPTTAWSQFIEVSGVSTTEREDAAGKSGKPDKKLKPPNQRGLKRKQIVNKEGNKQIVWVRPDEPKPTRSRRSAKSLSDQEWLKKRGVNITRSDGDSYFEKVSDELAHTYDKTIRSTLSKFEAFGIKTGAMVRLEPDSDIKGFKTKQGFGTHFELCGKRYKGYENTFGWCVGRNIFLYTHNRLELESAYRSANSDLKMNSEYFKPFFAVPNDEGTVAHELGHFIYSGLKEEDRQRWKEAWQRSVQGYDRQLAEDEIYEKTEEIGDLFEDFDFSPSTPENDEPKEPNPWDEDPDSFDLDFSPNTSGDDHIAPFTFTTKVTSEYIPPRTPSGYYESKASEGFAEAVSLYINEPDRQGHHRLSDEVKQLLPELMRKPFAEDYTKGMDK